MVSTVNTPISQLTPATLPLTGAEEIPMDQAGVTVKASSGALAAAVGSVPLTLTAGLTVTGGTVDFSRLGFGSILLSGGNPGGYLDIPLTIQNVNYQFTPSDRGSGIRHTAAGAHTYTIADNATVPMPIGAVITVEVGSASGNVTIAPAGGVTLRQAGTTNTGNRTIAANGLCTLLNVGVDEWKINGVGLT